MSCACVQAVSLPCPANQRHILLRPVNLLNRLLQHPSRYPSHPTHPTHTWSQCVCSQCSHRSMPSYRPSSLVAANLPAPPNVQQARFLQFERRWRCACVYRLVVPATCNVCTGETVSCKNKKHSNVATFVTNHRHHHMVVEAADPCHYYVWWS